MFLVFFLQVWYSVPYKDTLFTFITVVLDVYSTSNLTVGGVFQISNTSGSISLSVDSALIVNNGGVYIAYLHSFSFYISNAHVFLDVHASQDHPVLTHF